MTQFPAATSSEQTLHAALELSKNSWLLAIQFPDRDNPSLYPIRGGNAEGLMAKRVSPVVAEAFSLLQNNCPGLNKKQSPAPTVPQARKERPEKPITRGYPLATDALRLRVELMQ